MSAAELIAIDVAILPPPEVAARAIALSRSLPDKGAGSLRLDEAHLSHVTLTQQFVRTEELVQVFERVDGVLAERPPVTIHVTGTGRSGSTVWMAIEATSALVELHHELMEALRGLERPDGGHAAFFDTNARARDVLWVSSFRLKSSFGAFVPHLTLGHAAEPPVVEPFAFQGTHVAVCHLGRFCTCRRVLRHWDRSRHEQSRSG